MSAESVFAERVRFERHVQGITQLQLSEAMASAGTEMDRSVIAKIETGKRGVGLNEALAFSAALGYQLTDLLDPDAEREVRFAALRARCFAAGLVLVDPRNSRMTITALTEDQSC